MVPLASGHLYNKIQNHERITKLKKRKSKSQLFLVKLKSHFLSEKTEKEKKKIRKEKELHYLLFENV